MKTARPDMGKVGIVLLIVGLTVFTASAFAKKRNEAAPPTTVLAHLPLPGPSATQMFMQDQGGKHYLYIDQGRDQGYAVVDVTKPDQPDLVKHVAGGSLQIVGGGLGVAETPDSRAAAPSHVPTSSIQVFDLTDPRNPKPVQTFTGVSSVLQDTGRGLLYITNNDGLYVLRNNEVIQPGNNKPLCGSESAISAMPPDCQ